LFAIRRLQTSQYEPIRIVPIYLNYDTSTATTGKLNGRKRSRAVECMNCTIFSLFCDGAVEQKIYINGTLVPMAISRWSSLLQVIPVLGPLYAARSCTAGTRIARLSSQRVCCQCFPCHTKLAIHHIEARSLNQNRTFLQRSGPASAPSLQRIHTVPMVIRRCLSLQQITSVRMLCTQPPARARLCRQGLACPALTSHLFSPPKILRRVVAARSLVSLSCISCNVHIEKKAISNF
jgi:hypothetical protein